VHVFLWFIPFAGAYGPAQREAGPLHRQPAAARCVKAPVECTLDKEIEMKSSNNRLPGTTGHITTWMWVALMWSLMTLSACNSGGNNAAACTYSLAANLSRQ
jgi:hypothetical protein